MGQRELTGLRYNNMLKIIKAQIASEIIKESCCGNFLDVEKDKLVEMVKDLERNNVLLAHQLDNAIAELQKRGKR